MVFLEQQEREGEEWMEVGSPPSSRWNRDYGEAKEELELMEFVMERADCQQPVRQEGLIDELVDCYLSDFEQDP